MTKDFIVAEDSLLHASDAWSAIEIGLCVDDPEPMRQFYCGCLGFSAAGHLDLPSAHIEAFRFGDCLLKLTQFTDPAGQPTPHPPSPSENYLTLRVASLDDMVARCETAGVPLLVPVSSATTAEGRHVRFAFVADPMGNRVELVQGNAWSSPAT
jgi:catechol 2,3-dioxygenase-like lactoylglutathione lyase family enzyme